MCSIFIVKEKASFSTIIYVLQQLWRRLNLRHPEIVVMHIVLNQSHSEHITQHYYLPYCLLWHFGYRILFEGTRWRVVSCWHDEVRLDAHSFPQVVNFLRDVYFGHFKLHSDDEPSALPFFTLYLDVSIHHFNDDLGNPEPQTCTSIFTSKIRK